jgi:hypothetical protein
MPEQIAKYHQNLHLFRVKELPIILSEHQHLISPSSCCHDLILWQCVVDVIVSKKLFSQLKETETSRKSVHCTRELSAVSENAIRYTAGSVMRKLLEKLKNDVDFTECLNSMLKGGDDDSPEHIS